MVRNACLVVCLNKCKTGGQHHQECSVRTFCMHSSALCLISIVVSYHNHVFEIPHPPAPRIWLQDELMKNGYVAKYFGEVWPIANDFNTTHSAALTNLLDGGTLTNATVFVDGARSRMKRSFSSHASSPSGASSRGSSAGNSIGLASQYRTKYVCRDVPSWS